VKKPEYSHDGSGKKLTYEEKSPEHLKHSGSLKAGKTEGTKRVLNQGKGVGSWNVKKMSFKKKNWGYVRKE